MKNHPSHPLSLRALCLYVIGLLFCFSPGRALAESVVSEILISGNRLVDAETIQLQVSTAVGSVLDPEVIAEDIKNIYKMGYFSQVRASREEVGGKTRVQFVVTEKRAIRNVFLEGNELVKEEKIRDKLNISARRFFDPKKLRANIEEVQKYYEEQGYFGTKITFDTSEVDDQYLDVTLRIEEGIEKVIRQVIFEGRDGLSASDLKGVIATKPYRWWSSWLTGSGIVKDEVLENDVRELTNHYMKNGYAEVRVGDPVITDYEDGLQVAFKISEGALFYFESVHARGTLLNDSEEETLKGISIRPGELFDIEKLRADTFSVSDKFTDIGFAFANVEPITELDKEKKKVKVTFEVDKGLPVTINRIHLSGNEKTKDNVIRRSLNIQERDLFSSSKIRRSQELLQRLGYFEEVTITPEPSTLENEVDLGVAVREGQTGAFTIGAGISSGDGFIFSTRISEVNIFGSGNSVTADVALGTTTDNIILSFENPRVNDTYWSGGTELLSVEREFDDYDRKQAGMALSAGYPLWFLGSELLEDIRFSLRYEYVKINIDDVDIDASQVIKDEEGRSTSSSVTPQLVRNTINNPLDPTTGSRQVLGVELAGLGGQEEFWLFNASNTLYRPLVETSFGEIVFSHRITYGYGDTFNDETFPLFRRFFPGGINSVRGFEARELGPVDEEGSYYGGSKQLVTNFDLILPLVPQMGLKAVLFFDAGNAFDDDEPIDTNDLRLAVGWGIRWRSPIAPIRIEFGYPLDREPGEKSFVTNFTFGAPL